MKKMLMVFNPHAGKGIIADDLCEVIDVFTKGGYLVTAYTTQSPGDGYNRIKEWGADYDIIVASGGDGTLSEAVKALMALSMEQRDENGDPLRIPLGYIPAGSTNDVAASLKIPLDPVECARSIVDGVYFDYDVGSFNGEYFVYVAAFGAFTEVSYETPQEIKNVFGHAAYVYEGIKRINKVRGYDITVQHDGEVIKGNFILGFVSNSVSIAGMKSLAADSVCFDDGLFEVSLVKTPTNPLELSQILAEASTGKLSKKNFVVFKTSELVITSDERIAWTLDGEAGGEHTFVNILNKKQAVRLRIGIHDFTVEQEAVKQDKL